MTTETPKTDPALAAQTARRRSIAIAVMLVVMVVMFYAVTLVRFGGALATKVS